MHMRMRVWPRSAFMRSALLMRRLQGTTPARTTAAAQQTWEAQTQTPAPRPPAAPVRPQLPAPQQTALAVQRRPPTRRQSFSILRSLIMEKQARALRSHHSSIWDAAGVWPAITCLLMHTQGGPQVLSVLSGWCLSQVITRREGTSLGFVQQLYVQPQRLAVVIINLKNDRLPLTPPACSIDLAALQQIGDVLLVQDEQVTRQPDRYATETVTKLVGLEVVLQNGAKLGKVATLIMLRREGHVSSHCGSSIAHSPCAGASSGCVRLKGACMPSAVIVVVLHRCETFPLTPTLGCWTASSTTGLDSRWCLDP